jgi:magnesium-transporting ATPase (P-type)
MSPANAPHSEPTGALLAALGTDPHHGLDTGSVAVRQQEHGRNTLPPAQQRTSLQRFLLQFHNVLIYILLASAGITALLGHWVDAGVIVGVVLINAVIGHIQEGKAEAALGAIRKMLSARAVVLRDGHRQEIDAAELVPGDLVFLASGDRIPADLRLLEVHSLRVDESALTGESVAVNKDSAACAADTPLGSRSGMAYSGTLVTYGQAMGIVVATGSRSEIGRISTLLKEVEELATPLLRKMAVFGRWLSAFILMLAVLIFLFGIYFRDFSADEMFLAAVGIAVAAIPEGMPAIMTITLAIGVRAMARRHAIVRRLPAVEALGAVTVICTDKTGTLTRNEMTVQHVVCGKNDYRVAGVGYAPRGGFELAGTPVLLDEHPCLAEISRAALLCNDASLHCDAAGHWQLTGDPTEGALVTLAMKAGLDPAFEHEALLRSDVIPFESEHRFMATLHHDHAGHGRIYLKGAPERILALCTDQRGAAGKAPLDAAACHERAMHIAAQGMRLLAVAVKGAAPTQQTLAFADVEAGGFILLALLGLADPPREEAIAAVATCHRAGIAVKMITGDHALTASAIGGQLGLHRDGGKLQVLTGADIENMDDAALAGAVLRTEVFARASPEHKLRIVKALQMQGHAVAMTGDGVNDAPALKRADVGVAMGHKGTEAAKEAAEIVLADDNFASIAAAVEEGRTVYDNIRKAIVFTLPTNLGEAGMLLVAILFGLPLPITPVQILWVNMITEVTLGLAIAFEKPEADIMQRQPRNPNESLLSPFLVWRIAFVSLLMVAGALGLFLWHLEQGSDMSLARSVAVNTIVIGEMVYLLNVRHLSNSVLSREGLFGNRYVLGAIAVLTVFQLAFTYLPPMQAMFGTSAMSAADWLPVLFFCGALFLLVEIEKRFYRRYFPRTA